MRWGHVALARRSQEEADRFFVGLLGLARTRARDLPADLATAVFGFAEPCRMIDYEGDGLRFEIFVPAAAERPPLAPSDYRHVCLQVGDRESLLTRAAQAGVEVRRASRAGRDVAFLADSDGNLFEIQPVS
jgi:catechol 2,3-dioxygenase-like lactoylglutathione lyase family enzyme